jgi:hypothetical protein
MENFYRYIIIYIKTKINIYEFVCVCKTMFTYTVSTNKIATEKIKFLVR